MERSSGWLRKNWQHTWRWNRHLHQHLQRNLKKLAKIVPVKLPQTPNLWAILLHGPVPTGSLSVLISNSKKHFHWFIYPSAVKANGCENTTDRSPIYQSCSCNSVRVGVNFLGSHIYTRAMANKVGNPLVCVCVLLHWELVCLYSSNCCFSVFVLVYVCPAGSCMLDSKHAAQTDSGVKLLVQTPPLKLNHMSIRFLSLSSLILSVLQG